MLFEVLEDTTSNRWILDLGSRIDHWSGIHTAVAEVTSNAVTSTAMFFPKHSRYTRQWKMYQKKWVSDFMPNVNSYNEGMEFRSVSIPPDMFHCVLNCTL